MTSVGSSAGEELTSCRACGADALEPFYDVAAVPVHSCVLLGSREEARGIARGDIRLAFCTGCGFITNTRFDRSLLDYSQEYEETQGYSPRFNRFAEELAGDLVARYGLRGKEVIEIGCGSRAEFLTLLCELGGNSGLGVDPSYRADRVEIRPTAAVTVLREPFGDRHSDIAADLLCCRHTLEHIDDVGKFLDRCRVVLENRAGSAAFFEVPDVRRVLREVAFWDIYHEHCSYFGKGSLARTFRRHGFEPTTLATGFDEQYLLMDAVVSSHRSIQTPLAAEESLETLASEVDGFRARHADVISGWRSQLVELHERGRRVVLWGSGSKGVAFLTTLDLRDEVELVVDINPFRQGMYMAGTGQEIVAPERLRRDRPDVVLVMNPVYEQEIGVSLAEMGLRPEIRPVEPSADGAVPNLVRTA